MVFTLKFKLIPIQDFKVRVTINHLKLTDFKENHLFSLNKPHKFDYNKISLIEIPKNLSKSLNCNQNCYKCNDYSICFQIVWLLYFLLM